MRMVSWGLVSLFLLASAPGAAADSPGGIRVSWPEPDKPWQAGSTVEITVDGPAARGATAIWYRWLGGRSQVLAQGKAPASPRTGFRFPIQVPRFSDQGTPELHLEIERAGSDSWLFKAGREFDSPKLAGLTRDAEAPVFLEQRLATGSSARSVEFTVQDASGIGDAYLVVGAPGSTELVRGQCKGESPRYRCRFMLPAGHPAPEVQARISDLAGNRAVASVRWEGKP
jgi:hypothetical protein